MQQALQCQKKSQEGWGNQDGFKELGLELSVYKVWTSTFRNLVKEHSRLKA